MRGTPLLAFALALIASPAHATASVACSAEDATLALSLGAAFGRALGAGIANFGATLTIHVPHVAPDLRALKLDRSDLSQSWWHEETLNFALHRDQLNSSLDLIIETRQHPSEENRYDGRYRLIIAPAPPGSASTIGAAAEWRGAVSCSAD